MAARTRKQRHDDLTRQRIQTSQLVNRLTNHALGKCVMESTQVTAALGLLRKTLPDLASMDATIQGDLVQHVVSGEPMSEDDWETRYGDSLATTGGTSKSTH